MSSIAVTAMQGEQPAEVTQKDDEHWVAGQADATWQIRVWNNPGVTLPATGGPGTRHYILWGMMLLGIAAAGFLFKRRIS